MKKPILLYGILSGVISSALLLWVVHYLATGNYHRGDYLGYTSMALSALLVFFGIRSYRETAGGALTFGRAFLVGLSITALSAAIYVAFFQVLYFAAIPGLGEKYAACMVDRVRDSGASAAEIVKAANQARTMKELLDRPLTNIALTFGEAFPVGLIFSLISAAILRKRK